MGRQAGAEVKEKKRKARSPDIAAAEVGEGGEGKASSVKKKKHGAKHTQEQAPEPDKLRVNEAAALEAARAASNVIRLLEQAPAELPQATDKGRKSKKSSGESWSGKDRTDVKFGRFSKDEKSALMAGVLEYAVEHNLSTTDLSWVSQGARKGGRRGFVKDLVSRVLPHRRINCVAQLLRKMCWTPDVRKGRWTDEETERLFALVAQHGRKWVLIGRELDRHPETVKDRWRATAEGDREKRNGPWSTMEEDRLIQAIKDLSEGRAQVLAAQAQERSEAAAEGSGKDSSLMTKVSIGRHGAGKRLSTLFIDQIDWDWVARQVGHRSESMCRGHWYNKLAPSMVQRGDWGQGEDKALVQALWEGGWEQDWEVPWDKLVAGRDGAAAKRRWHLLCNAVRDSRNKDFSEVVDHLVQHFILRPQAPDPAEHQVDHEKLSRRAAARAQANAALKNSASSWALEAAQERLAPPAQPQGQGRVVQRQGGQQVRAPQEQEREQGQGGRPSGRGRHGEHDNWGDRSFGGEEVMIVGDEVESEEEEEVEEVVEGAGAAAAGKGVGQRTGSSADGDDCSEDSSSSDEADSSSSDDSSSEEAGPDPYPAVLATPHQPSLVLNRQGPLAVANEAEPRQQKQRKQKQQQQVGQQQARQERQAGQQQQQQVGQHESRQERQAGQQQQQQAGQQQQSRQQPDRPHDRVQQGSVAVAAAKVGGPRQQAMPAELDRAAIQPAHSIDPLTHRQSRLGSKATGVEASEHDTCKSDGAGSSDSSSSLGGSDDSCGSSSDDSSSSSDDSGKGVARSQSIIATSTAGKAVKDTIRCGNSTDDSSNSDDCDIAASTAQLSNKAAALDVRANENGSRPQLAGYKRASGKQSKHVHRDL